MQNTIYSIDSAKAIKAQSYGYLNGIHYMAPHRSGGVGDLCGNASPGCINLCLGKHSGQAGMVSDTDSDNMEANATRKSRVTKARRFMTERAEYMCDLIRSTRLLVNRAERMNLIPVARPNGATDIAWELIRVRAAWAIEFPYLIPFVGKNLMEIFPTVQFVDYTKNPRRFDRPLPANYSLTFSRSETNLADCIALLNRGVNVAVVFESLPETWNGYAVIDGDKHDLRQLDPKGPIGTVIGLLPKGRKAKRDESGFVLRDHGAILS
jgi:hypothetical protein